MRYSRMDGCLDRLRTRTPILPLPTKRVNSRLKMSLQAEYKLGYWHEACGTNSKAPVAVTVEAGGTVTQDFTLKMK